MGGVRTLISLKKQWFSLTVSKLFAKLAQIQASLRSVPETGHNKFHGYSYATAEDIINAVRPICSSHGIFISISCIEHQILNDGKAASVIVALTATDCETGESTICTMPGYAEDTKSDKSLWKAMTGASKYAIRSFFCLASGDDPERIDDGKMPIQTEDKGPLIPRPNFLTNSNPPVDNMPKQKSEITKIQIVKKDPHFSITETSPGLSHTPEEMQETMDQMRRLGWSNSDGKKFLQENFGCSTRKELSREQMAAFLEYLRNAKTELEKNNGSTNFPAPSRNLATFTRVQLTNLEKRLMYATRNTEFGDAAEGAVWVFAVINSSGLDAKEARGVISSLAQKGLLIVSDYEGRGKADDMTIELTKTGIELESEYLVS